MSDGGQGSPPGGRDPQAADTGSGSTVYELCNVFGTPTGRRVVLTQGEELPAAPHGWAWRAVAV